MKVSKITFAALSALTLISVSAQAQSTSDSMRWPMNGTSNTMPNDMPNGTPNSAPNSTGASTDPSFDWKKLLNQMARQQRGNHQANAANHPITHVFHKKANPTVNRLKREHPAIHPVTHHFHHPIQVSTHLATRLKHPA